MTDSYDVIVIGAGAAGLTASAVVGALDKRVALIEREHLGGDCTWTGCVPSKALLKVARIAHTVRIADQFGIQAAPSQVDMRFVRAHIQTIIQEIYQHETPEAFSKRGVDVIQGTARFIDPHHVVVGDRTLRAKKFVIATGARPTVPNIPGIESIPYKTNLNLFDNDVLPEHLLVLGAGPIGMEMAQAYTRLGARVTVVGEAVLPRDEPDAVTVLRRVLEQEGVRFVLGQVIGVRQDNGEVVLTTHTGTEVQGDMLLVAVGRTPNVDLLALDKAGVAFSPQGIPVNAYLQTNIPHIYAAGDCTTGPKFTHYAGAQGAVAGRNTLLPFAKSKGLPQHVPWVTFTEPELAHIGLTEAEARNQHGAAAKVFILPLTEGDRSVADRDTQGFVKLVYKSGGKLLGATVLADRAGEMIAEYTLVMNDKLSLHDLDKVMHPYPTYADIAKKAVSNLLIEELLASRGFRLLKRLVRWLP
jgi:pyruvate/2-oxoglutarate dehydrogenase complex dihydrolipoamide dehydrogenase (E3) component